MLDITKIPVSVLDALHNRGHSDAEISALSSSEAFDEFCMWHGLINWGPTLRRTVHVLDYAAGQLQGTP